MKLLSRSRSLCNVCERKRRERREKERKRVNNIKKCKKKKKAVVRKKAKIYLQTKDTHLGDAQSTIQFGKHVRKYANGQGVRQEFTKAREWWTKAAAQRDEDATKALKR